jgi:hypothetical protein
VSYANGTLRGKDCRQKVKYDAVSAVCSLAVYKSRTVQLRILVIHASTVHAVGEVKQVSIDPYVS